MKTKYPNISLALIALLALAFGGVFLLIWASAEPFNQQGWQDIATMAWALVPVGLFLLMLSLGRAVSYLYRPFRTYLEARTRQVVAERLCLIESTAAQVALNDALMWQARHNSKAARVGR
uniref:Uncharacterized protein n=3 Tax=unclassified bacterial viruses TaxID=12333 RepID=A0AAU6W105_9VIRU